MRVLVPLAEGFEELEFITIVDILRRAGIEVVIAGLHDGLIEGAHKVKMMPDKSLDSADSKDFDAIVLPGGYPGFVNLREDPRVIKAVQDLHNAGKCVAAICGAPSVLLKAGILEGRKATVHPAGKGEISACANYSNERVVVDGKLVTSQAAGTALEFSLRLVEMLAGRQKMTEVKEEILARM